MWNLFKSTLITSCKQPAIDCSICTFNTGGCLDFIDTIAWKRRYCLVSLWTIGQWIRNVYANSLERKKAATLLEYENSFLKVTRRVLVIMICTVLQNGEQAHSHCVLACGRYCTFIDSEASAVSSRSSSIIHLSICLLFTCTNHFPVYYMLVLHLDSVIMHGWCWWLSYSIC